MHSLSLIKHLTHSAADINECVNKKITLNILSLLFLLIIQCEDIVTYVTLMLIRFLNVIAFLNQYFNKVVIWNYLFVSIRWMSIFITFFKGLFNERKGKDGTFYPSAAIPGTIFDGRRKKPNIYFAIYNAVWNTLIIIFIGSYLIRYWER